MAGSPSGVARGVDEALAAVGQRAAHLLAGGDDEYVRLHREAELERAAADRGTVLRFQADAGAGEAWGGGRHERGDQGENGGFTDHEGDLRRWNRRECPLEPVKVRLSVAFADNSLRILGALGLAQEVETLNSDPMP
jgi:hypothetical protein